MTRFCPVEYEYVNNFSFYCMLSALEATAALGGKDLMPFYRVLDGGRDGELFRVGKTTEIYSNKLPNFIVYGWTIILCSYTFVFP